jgi:hypothetical protein
VVAFRVKAVDPDLRVGANATERNALRTCGLRSEAGHQNERCKSPCMQSLHLYSPFIVISALILVLAARYRAYA